MTVCRSYPEGKCEAGRGKGVRNRQAFSIFFSCKGLSEKRAREQRNRQHGNQQDARLGCGWCSSSPTQKQPPLGIGPVTGINIIPSPIGRDDIVLELADGAIVHVGEEGLFAETGVADGVVARDGDGCEDVDVVDVLAGCVCGAEERGALPKAGHDLLKWWWWWGLGEGEKGLQEVVKNRVRYVRGRRLERYAYLLLSVATVSRR